MKEKIETKTGEPSNDFQLAKEIFTSTKTDLRTLPPEQLKEVQRKLALLRGFEKSGLTAKQFTQRLRDNEAERLLHGYAKPEDVEHPSTFYKWMKDAAIPYNLRDRRLENSPDSTVPDWQLCYLIMELWHRPTVRTKRVVRDLEKIAKQNGWQTPKYDAVNRLKNRITKMGSPYDLIQKMMAGKFYQQYGMVIFRSYSHSNVRWEIDWCQLDFQVVGPDGKYVKPYVLLAIDCASRLIMGCMPTPEVPDTADYLRFLRYCFLPKSQNITWGGLTETIQTDNALIFKCADVKAALAALGINFDPIDEYCPSQDGIVERAIQRLKADIREQFASGLARKNLLTRDLKYVGSWAALKEELAEWVFEVCCVRKHSAIKMVPLQFWHTHLLKPEDGVADERSVHAACLISNQFTVYREGVKIGGSYYTSAQLSGHKKKKVKVYYNPDDKLHTVLAAINGEMVPLSLNTASDHQLQRALTNERASAVEAVREAATIIKEVTAKNLSVIVPASAKAEKEFEETKQKSKKKPEPPQSKIIDSVPDVQKGTINGV